MKRSVVKVDFPARASSEIENFNTIEEYLKSQGLNSEDYTYLPSTSPEEDTIYIIPKPKDKPIKVVFEGEPLKLNEEDGTIEMTLGQYMRLIELFREGAKEIDDLLGYNDE